MLSWGSSRPLFGAVVFAVAINGWISMLRAQSPKPDMPAQAGAAKVPVVIELFTSEGCSSCPPADIFLQKMDTYQPIEGAQLIVLSEHVTYWDQQGWKDPNSSTIFTERQSSYEGPLGVAEPFTPQLIVDGNQPVSLQDTKHIEDVLNNEKTAPRIPVRISDVAIDTRNPSVLRAHLDADSNFEKHAADLYVALALNHVESQVLRGENGGKHLVHVAVVQQLIKVGKLSKRKPYSGEVELKIKPGEDPGNLRLVAFIQETGLGKMLGAALRSPL